MSNHDTILPQRVPRSARSGLFTHTTLPRELLQKGRRRLAFLAGLMVVLCLLSVGIETTLGGRSTQLLVLYSMVLALSTGLIALCRVDRVDHHRVLQLGLVYEVLICLAISLAFTWQNVRDTGHVPFLTWTVIWMVFFPLIIPSPPKVTLVVALLAAATAPASVAILHGLGELFAVPYDYFIVSVSPALLVIVAVTSSRVIYGLNVDVARAQKLGSYQLVEKLGQGGMGEVWRAEHQLLARPAAIKLISTPDSADPDSGGDTFVSRFQREAQATASLESEHTVTLYDYGVTGDGKCYYVMELLDGLDLDELIKRFGPLPPERAVHILVQACHSLAEAHHRGLVHRDIKPANLYLCRKGLDTDFVKVLDFGLVKTVVQGVKDDSLTMDGNVTGTPAFIAPELAVGEKNIDGRADLYALGCVGYWLLSGKLVFEAETPMGMLMEHAKTEPVRLSARTELELPEGLEEAIHACLKKDPADRPQSARQLAERLSAIELGEPWTPRRAERWWEVHLPPRAIVEQRVE